jgi:hypothetical protein
LGALFCALGLSSVSGAVVREGGRDAAVGRSPPRLHSGLMTPRGAELKAASERCADKEVQEQMHLNLPSGCSRHVALATCLGLRERQVPSTSLVPPGPGAPRHGAHMPDKFSTLRCGETGLLVPPDTRTLPIGSAASAYTAHIESHNSCQRIP